MKNPYVLACLLLLLLPSVLCLALQEDDLVFDDADEESTSSTTATVISRRYEEQQHKASWHEQKRPHESKKFHQLDRLRDIPHVVVPVGHVLKLKVDREMFSGPEDYYELFDPNGNKLLRWLYWEDSESTLLGIPTKKDVGSHRLSVKVMGKHDDTAKDLFVVQVVPEKHEELKHKDGKTHCNEGEEQTLLTILLDAKFDNLMPCTRVNAIENLALFLGLHVSAFSMHPQSAKENLNADSSVILSGPGNVKHRKEKHLTAIQWQVGCDGHLWRHQTDLVKHLREQAKDGTLAEVMQLPVLLWRVKTESSLLLRNRREAGSGDYSNPDDYGGYDDYEDEYEDGEEYGEDGDDLQVQPTIMPETNSARGNTGPERPHRHHHGEKPIDWNTEQIDDVIPDVNQANVLESGVNRVAGNTTTTPMEQTSVPSTKQSTTLLPITVPANATNTSTTITLDMNTVTPPITTTQMRTTPTTTTSTTTTTTTMAPTTTNATTTTTTAAPTTIGVTTE